jgi:hypothetical protein
MFNKVQSGIFTSWFLLTVFFVSSSKGYAQFEGVSIHSDFLSINIPAGLDKNYYHPGNFLAGLQYNYPTSTDFELNVGLDFLYAEATGLINSVSRQVEVFIPSIFAGFVINSDDWGFFGKAGYAPVGSINQHNHKEWVSTIPGFDMYPVQFGVKYKVLKDVDINASMGYYIGNSVKIDDHIVSLTTVNLGISFNLFGSHFETYTDNYKLMYNDLQLQNTNLEKQNQYLIKQVDDIVKRLNKPGKEVEATADSVLPRTPLVSISIDSINTIYNLHIGKPLSIKTFVNRNSVSNDGKLILGEYNSIAASLKGFPAGIWLVCSVPDTNAFLSYKDDFPRMYFKKDYGIKKNLVINIDINKTETSNGIKLEVK